MKATIDTNQLKDAIQKINGIRLTRLQLPVLTYAHAKFADGKLVLTASDLEKAIRVEVKSKSDEDCSMCLPRKTLSHFLYTRKDFQNKNDKVEFAQGSFKQQVSIKRSNFGDATISVLPEKEFPPIPFADKLTWYTLDSKWFCRMLKIILPACATEYSRPILTGIVFKDGEIAAADGFRLHTLKDKKLFFGLGNKQTIINREVIMLIIKLFSKEELIDIAFEYTGNNPDKEVRRIYIKSGNTTLVAECTLGNYPHYEQLIPKSFVCKAIFSAPLLLQRLNMIDVQSTTSGITRYIIHRTEPNNQDELLIQAHIDNDEGIYSLTMPIKILADVGKIAVQHKYMIEALNPFSICTVETTNPSSPVKITGDIKGLTMVIMPMFVQW
jgi:DNA polymerase III sliding clamp (beta) subunit (PCNA family)